MSVFSLLVLATQLQAQAPLSTPGQSIPTTGAIDGIVKSTTDAQGIPDVKVTLEGTPAVGGPAPVRLSQNTDSGGHFSFTRLPLGRYTITAQHDHYFSLQAGASSY